MDRRDAVGWLAICSTSSSKRRGLIRLPEDEVEAALCEAIHTWQSSNNRFRWINAPEEPTHKYDD
jgi:hypothetical protein